MHSRTLIRIAVLLALGTLGPALAQEQTCIHRTADGRCVHWVPAPTHSGQARADGRTYSQSTPSSQSPQSSQGSQSSPSAPTSGCVYDPLNRTYRQCFHIDANGRCHHFGGRCN